MIPRQIKKPDHLIVIWIILNFIPALLIERPHQVKMWLSISLNIAQQSALLFLQLSILTLEVTSFLLLLVLIKKLTRDLPRIISSLISLMVTACCAVYITLLSLSWALFLARGAFIQLNDFAFIASFSDPLVIMHWISAGDLLSLLLVVGASAALSILAGLEVRRLTAIRIRKLVSLQILSALLIALLLWNTTKYPGQILVYARNFISPQLSLIFGLFSTDSIQKFDVVQLNLQPVPTASETSANIASVPKKNVLVFVIEALRSDVTEAGGGNPAILPNINKLAKRGIQMPYAWAQSPETNYSQSTIITAQFPLRFPLRNLNYDHSYPYNKIYDVLADYKFRSAYLTTEINAGKRLSASSKLNLYSDPMFGDLSAAPQADRPIRYSLDLQLPQVDRGNIEKLRTFIQESVAAHERFFALTYLCSSHFPYDPELDSERLFRPDQLNSSVSFLGYPKELVPVMKNRYFNSLHRIDALVGSVIQDLESTGALEDTIIAITGDHGDLFQESPGKVAHGSGLEEFSLRVPLIFANAGAYRSNLQSAEISGHVDIAPTVLSLLGLPANPHFQGRSVLSPETDFNTHNKNEKSAAINLVRPMFATVQTTDFQDAIIVYPYKLIANHQNSSIALYNVASDPAEQQELSQVKPDLAKALSAALNNFRNKQLSYYSLPKVTRDRHLPPAIDSFDISPFAADFTASN